MQTDKCGVYCTAIVCTHAPTTCASICKHAHYFCRLRCLHADGDRDPPSLPFQSHKIINLTSVGHPILLGFPDSNAVNSSVDLTSRMSTERLPSTRAAAHPVIVSHPQSHCFMHCFIYVCVCIVLGFSFILLAL